MELTNGSVRLRVMHAFERFPSQCPSCIGMTAWICTRYSPRRDQAYRLSPAGRLCGNVGTRARGGLLRMAALRPGEGEGGLVDVAVGLYDELCAAAWGQADGE